MHILCLIEYTLTFNHNAPTLGTHEPGKRSKSQALARSRGPSECGDSIRNITLHVHSKSGHSNVTMNMHAHDRLRDNTVMATRAATAIPTSNNDPFLA